VRRGLGQFVGGGVQRVSLVLGARVDPTSYGAATRQVLEWARRGESRYVCVATVHSVMEAWDDPGFRGCRGALVRPII